MSENLLGVSFGEEGAWPSETTLLGEAGLAKMRAEFAAPRRALLHIGWDDVVTIRWNGKIAFDTSQDARQTKGLLHLDKYRFEKQVPIELRAGRNKLVVTSVNYHGAWGFDLRLTGEDGVPLSGLRFRLH